MKLVGSRRVFSVEEVSARLAAMFEGLRSFWLEAEVQDLRPAARPGLLHACAARRRWTPP